ncbi:hypothetical protein GH714_037732 [Hevea brasiliensis]|uniref:Uncharacterized protein n=1 Tax=Hevea brasiliensis TaxID=3981 RepID=A0A6A6L7H3_HEVBR|nr:hypothetical protein GH714_037732 [Hevea brasiliensis]
MADFVLSFVVDAALSRGATNDEGACETLAEEAQEAAYDAEDVFDELANENLRRKVEMQDQSGREVNKFFSFSKGTRYVKKAAFHFKMARKVKNINDLLNKIKNEAMGFGLQAVSRDRIMRLINLYRVTDSVLDNQLWGGKLMLLKL